MVTTNPDDEGVEQNRQDFTANDFRVTRALDSLLISAKAIIWQIRFGGPYKAEFEQPDARHTQVS